MLYVEMLKFLNNSIIFQAVIILKCTIQISGNENHAVTAHFESNNTHKQYFDA